MKPDFKILDLVCEAGVNEVGAAPAAAFFWAACVAAAPPPVAASKWVCMVLKNLYIDMTLPDPHAATNSYPS
jgi:hypothetical protein